MTDKQRSAPGQEIARAIQAVMRETPYIQKTGQVRGPQGHYAYASESDVLAAIRPAMVKHGLSIIPAVTDVRTSTAQTKSGGQTTYAYLSMEFTLLHVSGERMGPLPWEACGMDTQDKAVAKASTSGAKYFLLRLFQVETGTDPDKPEAEQPAAPQPAPAQRQQRPPAQSRDQVPQQLTEAPPQQAAPTQSGSAPWSGFGSPKAPEDGRIVLWMRDLAAREGSSALERTVVDAMPAILQAVPAGRKLEAVTAEFFRLCPDSIITFQAEATE